MPFSAFQRIKRPLAFFALQAALWIALTVAFATLINVAGWLSWTGALFFSAANWLPWIVLAPLVLWLAKLFPLERRHLWRSVPVHAVACALCAAGALWASALLAPASRPLMGGRPQFGDGGFPGGPGDGKRFDRGADDRGALRRGPMERRQNAPEGGDGGPRDRGPMEPGAMDGRKSRGGPGGHGGPPPDFGPGGFGRRGFFDRFVPPFSSAILRANFSAAVYLIVLCAAQALGYYRQAQDRDREALSLAASLNRAKLDALRLQLQPHFLFNTLNAISTLVHRDANAADELIGDLSELLRLSLQTADHEVPLSRELELLDCYLAIEQARLGDRLRIVRDIAPAALAALVPTFLLQPLAENAVRHGIEPRRAPGTLTIHARTDGDKLHLIVGDDGVGLKAAEPPSGRHGIGLANSEERLRALHGGAAKLELIAPPEGGVQVQIVLPWRTTPASLPPSTA